MRITNFVNHEYLFALLSVLTALMACLPRSGALASKMQLVRTMRIQILVVYFYSCLWKCHEDWLNGAIIKGIYLSFEEQGVHRGIPWATLYESFPAMFTWMARGALLLDLVIFASLFGTRPGHWTHWFPCLFHGFISITMSQRIGVFFPAVMLLSKVIFESIGPHDVTSPLEFVLPTRLLLPTRTKSTKSFSKTRQHQHLKKKKPKQSKRDKVEAESKRNASLWSSTFLGRVLTFVLYGYALFQCVFPLRMPVVSNNEYPYTFEAYRFSWTMMLHSKHSFVMPGVHFFNIYPRCDGRPFPNPHAKEPFANPHTFPVEQLIGPRGYAAITLFPRQLPRLAGKVHDFIRAIDLCQRNRSLAVTASVFSSVNDGPFRRIVDPSKNLSLLHFFRASRIGRLQGLFDALADKPPARFEYILRNFANGRDFPSQAELGNGWKLLVDRAPCLAYDPVRFFDNAVSFRVIRSPVTLTVSRCNGEGICERNTLTPGVDVLRSRGPAHMTVVQIMLDTIEGDHVDLSQERCSHEDQREDVVLAFRFESPTATGRQGAHIGGAMTGSTMPRKSSRRGGRKSQPSTNTQGEL
eukprot:g702.t1